MHFVTHAFTEPSKVRNETAEAISPTSFRVSWKEPEHKNGIIVGYRIDHRQLRWRHDCTKSLDYNNYFENTTSNSIVIENVKPFSQYRIRIRARTVKLGMKVVLIFNTPPSGRYLSCF